MRSGRRLCAFTESMTGPIFEIRDGIDASVTTSRALDAPAGTRPPLRVGLALPSLSQLRPRFLGKEKRGVVAGVRRVELVGTQGQSIEEFGIQRSVPLAFAEIVVPPLELATTEFFDGRPAVAELFCLYDEKAYTPLVDSRATPFRVERMLVNIEAGKPPQFPVEPFERISVVKGLFEAIHQDVRV